MKKVTFVHQHTMQTSKLNMSQLLHRSILTLVIVLYTCVLFAQTKPYNYEAAWKKVEALVNEKGLPESALSEVNIIHKIATAEKNEVQKLKALMYRASLRQPQDNAEITSIRELEKEAAQASEPSRSILNSLAAEAYHLFYQQHRWQMANRTNVLSHKTDDIDTWTPADFQTRIRNLYLESIKNEKLLQGMRISSIDPILVKGNARSLRPTLFDLLAHRALDYFQYADQFSTKAAASFQLNDANFLKSAELFRNINIRHSDSLSSKLLSLLIYQRLIEFHFQNRNVQALIDVDLMRMQFVYHGTTLNNKDSLYIEALDNLIRTYTASMQPRIALAQFYIERASRYSPLGDTSGKFAYTEAVSLLNPVLKSKDSSHSYKAAQQLLQQILAQSLNIQTEKVVSPGLPFRVLATYRNTPAIYGRIVRLDRATKEALGERSWEDTYWNRLLGIAVLKTFSYNLPATQDHHTHSVELKIDSLPLGQYAILISSDKSFQKNAAPLSVNFIHVSDIAYLSQGKRFFVANRQTGYPLVGANVQQWSKKYNRSTGKYVLQKENSYRTSPEGFFDLSSNLKSVNEQVYFEISHNNDYLFIDETGEYYSPYIEYTDFSKAGSEDEFIRKNSRAFIFTDRSIYRPGHQVAFKTILTSKSYNDKTPIGLINRKSRVFLLDANGTRVDSLDVTTNSFGSYSGQFQLPTSGLTGTYQLQDDFSASTQSISVEEYKRPRFYTQLESATRQPRVNDSIRITGSIVSFDGSAMSNAIAAFRVVRRSHLPFSPTIRMWPPYLQESVEIINGTITADASGKFSFIFPAIPDSRLKKEQQPVFYFEVTADVTDVSGETRSASTTIPIGYQALQITLKMPETLPADSTKSISVTTTNLSGDFVKTLISLRVKRLQEPTLVLRPRRWEKPDQFIMSAEEYHSFFPHDVYKDEDQMSSWKEISVVHERKDSSSMNSYFQLNENLLASGSYRIEATALDAHGEKVTAVQHVRVIDNKPLNGLIYSSLSVDQQTTQPGRQVNLKLSTNVSDVKAIYVVQFGDTLQPSSIISLADHQAKSKIGINEQHRGGVSVSVSFIRFNHLFRESLEINVPYTNKELNISYQTYRDKTLPGAKENWKIKVAGIRGEKIAAEVMSTLFDASLDQFQMHTWKIPDLWGKRMPAIAWVDYNNFGLSIANVSYPQIKAIEYVPKIYDQLLTRSAYRLMTMRKGLTSAGERDASAPVAREEMKASNVAPQGMEVSEQLDGAGSSNVVTADKPFGPQLRKNFSETAFMFPTLATDSAGNIELSFTIPEATTTWKWLTLAHTQDLAFGIGEKSIITQKQLMVRPNAPRFLREGDRMDFSGSIANLSNKELTGQVELQLLDPTTNQSVDGWFRNMFPNQYFTAAPGETVPVSFTIEVPFEYSRPVIYRLIARSDSLSDGEENYLPVVSNRILLTEALPLSIRGTSQKQFTFEKLINSPRSETLTHHALTVEFTSNPTWYVVQALPTVASKTCECTDQLINTYYANALASHIATSLPQLQSILKRWSIADTASFLSNLNKNQELKTILLQETPWVLEAKTEEEQRRNVASLFNIVHMTEQLQSALDRLKEAQAPSGGFSWLKGAPEDLYTTQYVVASVGRLFSLGAVPKEQQAHLMTVTRAAIRYLDQRLASDFEKTKARLPKGQLPGLTPDIIHYLYSRSFYAEVVSVPGKTFPAFNHYRKLSQKEWVKQNSYLKGLIALSLFRTGDVQAAKNIVASLKQFAVKDPELGMYWKSQFAGYRWHESAIESQALLIEAFAEISNDTIAVDEMKTWLIRNKQTNSWKTPRASAEASYAILLQGKNWVSNAPQVEVRLGNLTLPQATDNMETTGYFKQTVAPKDIKPELGNVQVFIRSEATKSSARPAWGAVYWQYFESLENVTFAKTPLQLDKQLYIKKNSDTGPKLQSIRDGEIIKVGDRLTVRIVLKVDRDMEYVHMKDMRASALEPVNVLSSFKYQGGLGYYESTRDASTSFFFGYLPKGTYVFEYELYVSHSGTYNNGVASIESYYAPEFRSHSSSLRLNIEQQ